jgi:hypothetical protein
LLLVVSTPASGVVDTMALLLQETSKKKPAGKRIWCNFI